MISQFDMLLQALGENRLRQHMRDRLPLHAPAPPGFRPNSLFSFEALADLFARRVVPAEALRVMARRKSIDLAAFDALDGIWVHPLAMNRLARGGATAVLFNVDRIAPSLWPFACDAENWFGDKVSISAVASFDRVSGLELHYDCHNLLIVQLEGEKKWTFYGDPEPGPARAQTQVAAESNYLVTGEILMRPGDVLFVPAGLRHRCEPARRSLHLGLLAHQLSGVTLAEWLLDAARGDIVLNELDLPPLGVEASGARTESFRTRLIELVGKMDIAALFAAQRLRDARVRRMSWDPDVSAGSDDCVAELVLSHWPKGIAPGRVRVRGAVVTLTEDSAAIARALADGPLAIASLAERVAPAVRQDRFADALKLLLDANLLRLVPSDPLVSNL